MNKRTMTIIGGILLLSELAAFWNGFQFGRTYRYQPFKMRSTV